MTLKILYKLRKLGVGIVMDDFGMGYSSLSYLRSFPFDKLKLDGTFVRDAAIHADDRAIVRAVAGMAKALGMETTAEGVETESHQEVITDERLFASARLSLQQTQTGAGDTRRVFFGCRDPGITDYGIL